MPDQSKTTQPETWLYDAKFQRRVANVTAVAMIIGCIFVTAPAKAGNEPALSVIDGGVERSEDAPHVPADYEFLPGEYLYFTFHIAGFKIKSNEKGDVQELSLQYRITPQDMNGVALAATAEDTVSGEINKEDKNWTPKRRANFLLPPFVASGDYRLHVAVKDMIANTEAVRDYPFKIGGTRIPASVATIRADGFEFLRSPEDSKPVEVPAYAAGDTLYARFIMDGFKVETGNKYRLAYGIKIIRPDGKVFLDDPKAAQIMADSFYPAQFVPGDIQVTTPRDALHGRYQLTLTVRDLISNRAFDLKEGFTIE